MHTGRELGFDWSGLVSSVGTLYTAKLQMQIARQRAEAEARAAAAQAAAASAPLTPAGLRYYTPYMIGGVALLAVIAVTLWGERR